MIFFTRTLDFSGGPGLIRRLVEKGGPWGYTTSGINDANYPTKGEGIVTVRYRVLKGYGLNRADGFVYRADVEARFRAEEMRCPNAAEALLVPAESKQIGRRDHPLVAFISGSGDAFIVNENERERKLNLNSYNDNSNPNYEFVGVC